MYRLIIAFILVLSIFSPSNGRSSEPHSNDEIYISFYNRTVKHLLPQFRIPRTQDLKYAWSWKNSFVYKTTDNEKKYKAPYWTKGFFNGDDIIDFAYILINKNDNKKYLFAILSIGNQYKPILLQDEHDDEMGVATQHQERDIGSLVRTIPQRSM